MSFLYSFFFIFLISGCAKKVDLQVRAQEPFGGTIIYPPSETQEDDSILPSTDEESELIAENQDSQNDYDSEVITTDNTQPQLEPSPTNEPVYFLKPNVSFENEISLTNWIHEVHDVQSGSSHSCAIIGAKRQVYCWGDNSKRQLDRSSSIEYSYNLLPISYLNFKKFNPLSRASLTNVEEIRIFGDQNFAKLSNQNWISWSENLPPHLISQQSEIGPKIIGNRKTWCTWDRNFISTNNNEAIATQLRCFGENKNFEDKFNEFFFKNHAPKKIDEKNIALGGNRLCALYTESHENKIFCVYKKDNKTKTIQGNIRIKFKKIEISSTSEICGITEFSKVYCGNGVLALQNPKIQPLKIENNQTLFASDVYAQKSGDKYTTQFCFKTSKNNHEYQAIYCIKSQSKKLKEIKVKNNLKLTSIQSVTLGQDFGCMTAQPASALYKSKTLFCWGKNDKRQLGLSWDQFSDEVSIQAMPIFETNISQK